MTDKQKSVVDLVADVLDELCGADFRGVKAICQRASYLEAELDKHRWRKVKDEMPEKNVIVLMFAPDYMESAITYWLCSIEDKHLWEHATHWKPITPPEQEKG